MSDSIPHEDSNAQLEIIENTEEMLDIDSLIQAISGFQGVEDMFSDKMIFSVRVFIREVLEYANPVNEDPLKGIPDSIINELIAEAVSEASTAVAEQIEEDLDEHLVDEDLQDTLQIFESLKDRHGDIHGKIEQIIRSRVDLPALKSNMLGLLKRVVDQYKQVIEIPFLRTEPEEEM